MSSRRRTLALIGLSLVCARDGGTQTLTAAPSATPRRALATSPDTLSVLRVRYLAEIRELLPQWKAAERAAHVADSLKGTLLPPDTLRVGSLHWLLDGSRSPSVREAVTRSWSHLLMVFGAETDVLRSHVFAAQLRRAGGEDTTRAVIDLEEVFPGRLDIFDRVNEDESVEVIARRVTLRAAEIVLQNGDSAVLNWLTEPFSPEPLFKGIRERMFADLMTSPSQVSSRCLAGDLRRCRDALGLIPTGDPLTEWYDAPERRRLVVRMHDLLATGSQRTEYAQCADRRSYAACDQLLRTIPRYVVPPPLPTSARHHLFRIALQSGGSGAYARLVGGQPRSVEARIADAGGMPIDSVVARWRADVLDARPPSPTPSLLSVWTAVGWGIGVLLVALRFTAWR